MLRRPQEPALLRIVWLEVLGCLGPGTTERNVDRLSGKTECVADERSVVAQRTCARLCALPWRPSRSISRRPEKFPVARVLLHRRRRQRNRFQHFPRRPQRTGDLRRNSGQRVIKEVGKREVLTRSADS